MAWDGRNISGGVVASDLLLSKGSIFYKVVWIAMTIAYWNLGTRKCDSTEIVSMGNWLIVTWLTRGIHRHGTYVGIVECDANLAQMAGVNNSGTRYCDDVEAWEGRLSLKGFSHAYGTNMNYSRISFGHNNYSYKITQPGIFNIDVNAPMGFRGTRCCDECKYWTDQIRVFLIARGFGFNSVWSYLETTGILSIWHREYTQIYKGTRYYCDYTHFEKWYSPSLQTHSLLRPMTSIKNWTVGYALLSVCDGFITGIWPQEGAKIGTRNHIFNYHPLLQGVIVFA